MAALVPVLLLHPVAGPADGLDGVDLGALDAAASSSGTGAATASRQVSCLAVGRRGGGRAPPDLAATGGIFSLRWPRRACLMRRGRASSMGRRAWMQLHLAVTHKTSHSLGVRYLQAKEKCQHGNHKVRKSDQISNHSNLNHHVGKLETAIAAIPDSKLPKDELDRRYNGNIN
jgi:hypothetical protein